MADCVCVFFFGFNKRVGVAIICFCSVFTRGIVFNMFHTLTTFINWKQEKEQNSMKKKKTTTTKRNHKKKKLLSTRKRNPRH
jgi:hypothetical protein